MQKMGDKLDVKEYILLINGTIIEKLVTYQFIGAKSYRIFFHALKNGLNRPNICPERTISKFII